MGAGARAGPGPSLHRVSAPQALQVLPLGGEKKGTLRFKPPPLAGPYDLRYMIDTGHLCQSTIVRCTFDIREDRLLQVRGRGGEGKRALRTRDPRSGGAYLVDGRDDARRSRAPGPDLCLRVVRLDWGGGGGWVGPWPVGGWVSLVLGNLAQGAYSPPGGGVGSGWVGGWVGG